jgi:hypothetical protein
VILDLIGNMKGRKSSEGISTYSQEAPEAPNREQSIQSFTQELEGIEAGKPSEAEWVLWRECKKCEEDLIAEFKGLGIELQFNLSQGGCWVLIHDFMIYRG